jgi:hypothetical protein
MNDYSLILEESLYVYHYRKCFEGRGSGSESRVAQKIA